MHAMRCMVAVHGDRRRANFFNCDPPLYSCFEQGCRKVIKRLKSARDNPNKEVVRVTVRSRLLDLLILDKSEKTSQWGQDITGFVNLPFEIVACTFVLFPVKFSRKSCCLLGPRRDVITCEICHMACNFSHNVWQVSSIWPCLIATFRRNHPGHSLSVRKMTAKPSGDMQEKKEIPAKMVEILENRVQNIS